MASPFSGILGDLQKRAVGEGMNSPLGNALRAFALQQIQGLTPDTSPGATKIQGRYGPGGGNPLQDLDFSNAERIFGVDPNSPASTIQGLEGLEKALPGRGLDDFLTRIAEEIEAQRLRQRRLDLPDLLPDIK